MLKTVFLVKRSQDLSHDEYVEHYLERHAPLTVRHLPGLRKYVVSVVPPDEEDPDRPDVVVELWWDALEDFLEIKFDSEEGERVLQEDMAYSMGASQAFVVEELVFKDPDPDRPCYRPGDPVASLGGRTLPGAGWT